MNMQTSPDSPENAADSAISPGYEAEGVEPSAKPAPKRNKADEMKRNVSAVFGSGIGKVAIVAVGFFVIVALALAYRGFTSEEKPDAENVATVDVPTAPANEVSVASVTPEEAKRRAEAAAREADAANKKGGSYQPGFDPNIEENPSLAAGEAQFGPGNQPPQMKGVAVGAGQGNSDAPAGSTQQQQASQTQQQQQQAAQRAQQEYKDAVTAQKEYVNNLREKFLVQTEAILGSKEERQQRNVNTTVAYYTPQAAQTPTPQTGSGQQPPSQPQPPQVGAGASGALTGAPIGDASGGRAPLIKTGNIMYATLDSEVNTDDGGHVLATVRGGDWDGAKLIGQIEQAPQNIRLNFTVLAPQDGRPTMRINAVALREDDAKQGVADDINRHTFARYTALAVASIAAGVGQVARQPVGDTIVLPNGQVVVTNQEPSDRRIIGSAVGELGTNIGQEVRQGFNRPTTFKTPAERGFGLYFLQDVYPQSSR